MDTPEVLTGTCRRCGAPIKLLPSGTHYKWMTERFGERGAMVQDWHCGDDPLFPVLGHAPVDQNAEVR